MKDSLNQKAEGVLRYDVMEGWVLDNKGPHAGIRICDLFPDLDGKLVRVTVEVLPEWTK